MGLSVETGIPVITVFIQGLLSFFLPLCAAACSFICQLSGRGNQDGGRKWKRTLPS